MTEIEQIIFKLFNDRWVGGNVTKDLSSMVKQLRRNLQNQVDGYWSGDTAYHIMIETNSTRRNVHGKRHNLGKKS